MSEVQHHTKHPHSSLNQLEAKLEEYFGKKAPSLPKEVKDFIVSFAPWLVLVGALLAVPAVLSILGLGTMIVGPYGAAIGYLGPAYYVSIIILAVVVVLELMALPGLFNRRKSGWNLLFYAVLLNAVSAIVTLNFVGFIIGTLLSLYLLFQVREYYK